MDDHYYGSATLPIVLVAADQNPAAVITHLRVRARANPRDDTPNHGLLEVTGEHPWLDPATAKRWREEIIPAAKAGLGSLGIAVDCWAVELRLPDAAALTEHPCVLEGCSADAAFFAALIASATGLHVRRDTLLTGGISMADDALSVVGHLPAKLLAAAAHPSIRHFLHAPIEADGSGAWVTEVLAGWDEACQISEPRVTRNACDGFTVAFQRLIEPDSLVIAALNNGWIEHDNVAEDSGDSSGGGWVGVLRGVTATTWQRQLDQRIHAGRRGLARRLIEAYVRHALLQDRYPKGLGASLHVSLRTVPAGQRRQRLRGMLISNELIERCGELASPDDRADFKILKTVAQGRVTSDGPGTGDAAAPIDDATPQSRLNWVLTSQSDPEASNRIDRALDEARLTFCPEPVDPYDAASFQDLITAFLTHLKRHAGHPIPALSHLVTAEAINLLEQAFAREGGSRAALAHAQDHTRGGVRGVLDRMTDTLKAQYRRADTTSAHLLAIDRQDLDGSLAQTRELLKRLGPLLPERFRDLPPEYAVAELETLIQETVRVGDQLTQVFRTR